MKQDLNLRTRHFRYGAEPTQLLHPDGHTNVVATPSLPNRLAYPPGRFVTDWTTGRGRGDVIHSDIH